MNILYIDESGDTSPLSANGSKYFVLSGCIIREEDILEIDKNFRQIKLDFYQDDEVEIKSNFLRYANPDISEDSPIKLNSRDKYDELEDRVTKFLIESELSLVPIVIDKEEYWKQYPAQNPYNIAYIFLLERFQKYLKKRNELGICIIDPREGRVEKHFLGNTLSDLHEKMRKTDGKIWSQCPNIAEKLLFSQSDKTNGIQVVDLLCYPIFHVFEYNKKQDGYWRYWETTRIKLLGDIGLKFFPDKKKKDLNFFR
jgi:hypothetical protein